MRSSNSTPANRTMSTAFGRRWKKDGKEKMVDRESRMPDEENMLYQELSLANDKRFTKQRANDVAASTQQSR